MVTVVSECYQFVKAA